MKLGYFFALLSLVFASSAKSQTEEVLMKINGKPIYKSEFEYIYNKNLSQGKNAVKSADDYLGMFVNFKLKVEEAKNCGIDTTKIFKDELEKYRNELALPYLSDNELKNRLVLEAYDRMKTNVEVSHILLLVDKNATEEQKQRVYEKISSLRERIVKGEDFNKLALENSQDPSAEINKGYLGFISAFTTVYPFEEASFSTPVGEVSEPVLTSFGYHLIKVHSRRNDPGEVKVAHILRLLPKNASQEKELQSKKEIEEIYNKLNAGESFDVLAKNESQDNYTSVSGGELPWLAPGRMVKEFEAAAYSLKNTGEYSKPFRTVYGWHIVKLLEKRGVPPLESKRADIIRRISRDERADMIKNSLTSRLKNEYDFEFNPQAEMFIRELCKTTDASDTVFVSKLKNSKIEMFSFKDNVKTIDDFSKYLEKNRISSKAPKGYPKDKVDDFIRYSLLSYEDKQLERKYPDFRNVVNEYKEGMMLFEISNKEVWEKASIDDKGLEDFFNKNKKLYSWQEKHFKGLVVKCKDKETEKKAKKIIKKAPADSIVYFLRKNFENDSLKVLSAERGLYKAGDNKLVDAAAFKIDKKYKDSNFPVYFIKGKVLKRGPESYEDVRGYVISDYQNWLESNWIESLKGKYVVEINEDVLKTVKPLK
ncbi:MAG: peptidylprolyl isomerase [Bacteroidales bacterium]|nr:peptidylprolyl isomerase [Bacteroidales bacterium]